MRSSNSKAEEYNELEQQYIDGEITEKEMEAEMEKLMQTGDDFLDEQPDMTSDLVFRAREIGQILGLVAVAGLTIFVFLMTKSAALLPMLVLGFVALLAYGRVRGAG